ncbi:LytTR family DNA-binding domain-containing protein [Paenibacillus sp. P32E]|uniref:LytTR family DNA-binding domain-containing protein n=1 Tax=Paenibacillus sp. P32E TaxID=1349434 RepID=UPI000939CDCA|nr:LytTR family DNA-binding domain-containing protein [Paenibacillus sp. P32E]OKP91363.1 hypothetical protein A3848_09660 [Paenibacillus sp. P32E]
MDKISVTKNSNGEGLALLGVDRILYLEYYRAINRILVHTKDEVFYTVGTLVYWLELLNRNGHRFVRADRNGIANLSKIKVMDKALYRGYFEDDASGKYCPFAESRFKAVSKKVSYSYQS